MKAQTIAIDKSEDVFAPARETLDTIIGTLESPDSMEMTHGQVEQQLFQQGMELLRRLFQSHLDLRGPGVVVEGCAVVGADGLARTHLRFHPCTLSSRFGDVTIGRTGYHKPGLESLHPLDADLNLPAKQYSHGVQRLVAQEACKQSFDETVATLKRYTAASVPKRQAEEIALDAAADFEAFYKRRQAQGPSDADQATLLSITADGKGVVVHKQDLREATRRAAERRKEAAAENFTLGLPKPPQPQREDRKRMATVASVYEVAPHVRSAEEVIGEMRRDPKPERPASRPRPQKKRVWASVEKDAAEVIGSAFAEAHARDPEHKRCWVALVDGNETQLTLFRWLALRYQVTLVIILDLMHVASYVWKAGFALLGRESPLLEDWVREHLGAILQGRSSLVAAGLRRSATLRGLSANRRKPVDVCAEYLQKYSPFLRYDLFLAAGYPIATGVIEGACRYVVKDRMEITGAVWRLMGAEAVLKLRSLHASGDFDEYWQFHEQCDYDRNHRSLYTDGRPTPVSKPTLQPAGRPTTHLSLVP
jgi:hypothetical protein